MEDSNNLVYLEICYKLAAKATALSPQQYAGHPKHFTVMSAGYKYTWETSNMQLLHVSCL